jgi:hypothetical protein
MGTKKSSGGASHRNAKNGRYVTEGYAKKHPDTTVRESRKKNK